MSTLSCPEFPPQSIPLNPASFDGEIQCLIPEQIESTALVLQGAVSMAKITDAATYLRVVSAGTDAASNIKKFTGVKQLTIPLELGPQAVVALIEKSNEDTQS
jgi:hypothetical protein